MYHGSKCSKGKARQLEPVSELGLLNATEPLFFKNQSLELVKVQLMKDNSRPHEVAQTVLPKPLKVQLNLDQSSVPTSKPMLLNSTSLSPVTDLVNEPSLRSSQPLLKYSREVMIFQALYGRD